MVSFRPREASGSSGNLVLAIVEVRPRRGCFFSVFLRVVPIVELYAVLVGPAGGPEISRKTPVKLRRYHFAHVTIDFSYL